MHIEKPLIKKIATFKDLPTLPHILLKLIGACNQENGSLKDIAGIVEKDPSLSSKILKIVNSALYSLPHRVEEIEQAVNLIGTNAVKNIAISASVYEAFNRKNETGIFNLKLFWWHSMKCAVMARLIAKNTKYSHPDDAFLAGLIHDIGRLVLCVNFTDQYENLLRIHKDQFDRLLEGEERLGATHSEVGAWLVHRWNLPSFISDSVLYHHEPLPRILQALQLVRIIYVANILSREPLLHQEDAYQAAEDVFGFEKAVVDELLAQSAEEAKAVSKSLEIEVEPPKGAEVGLSPGDIQKQEVLIHEVRDFSLLMGTLQNLIEADDLQGILKVVHQGLQILFDAKNILFFLYDPEEETLIGTTGGENNRDSGIAELVIPFKMGKSLLVRCLVEQQALHSFNASSEAQPIILDEQITRFMGHRGIFCTPMFAHGEHVGVIVLGVNQSDAKHLSSKRKLLNMFASQAALALRVNYFRRNRLKAIQSERLRASSAVARKVFHEVNNPLGIIKNYLKILGIKLSEHNIAQDEIRIINEEIDRVAQILRELASISGNRDIKKEPVQINRLLSDLVKITKESLFKNSQVEIQLDLQPNIPLVLAEKNGLKQIFINLIKNAVEAMAEGGKLSIKTLYVAGATGDGTERSGGKRSNRVEIIVGDSGPGIPEDIQAQIFDPFFTSKGDGHPGLGLSIVHNVIKELDGQIICETGKEQGTVFRIDLPILEDKSA